MGRYRGIGMPRAKKKMVEAARARIMDSLKEDTANSAQLPAAVDAAVAAASPCGAAAAPASAAQKALDEELRAARKEAREAAWVAGELEKEVVKAQKAQAVTGRVADAKLRQWEKEERGARSKRPSPMLQMQRCSKVEARIHRSVCDVYLAQVVAAQALFEARDAQIAASDVRIRQLLRRVRCSLKKSGQNSCVSRVQK